MRSLLNSGTPPSLLIAAAYQSCQTPPLPQYAIFSFFVIALAALTAPVTTFEPDFSSFTISAFGITWQSNSDNSTSILWGKENKIPFFNWFNIALFTTE